MASEFTLTEAELAIVARRAAEIIRTSQTGDEDASMAQWRGGSSKLGGDVREWNQARRPHKIQKPPRPHKP